MKSMTITAVRGGYTVHDADLVNPVYDIGIFKNIDDAFKYIDDMLVEPNFIWHDKRGIQ